MKRITIIVCGLVSLAASAYAAPVLKLEKIKQIVCEATAHYEEDTPNKKTPARAVKVFTRGSRKDLKPRPGAFLLAEFESADDGGLKVSDNQQFYFSPVKGGKLSFDFIANWKAHGELVPSRCTTIWATCRLASLCGMNALPQAQAQPPVDRVD